MRAQALKQAVVAPLIASFVLLSAPIPSIASEGFPIVIMTTKPLGPSLGKCSISGAFSDSGMLVTQRRQVSALPSPFGVVTHLVLECQATAGTFTIRAQIIETVTPDPDVFADNGVWVISDGTGAYSNLQGTGDVQGTVDDAANLITRVYTGTVRFH